MSEKQYPFRGKPKTKADTIFIVKRRYELIRSKVFADWKIPMEAAVD